MKREAVITFVGVLAACLCLSWPAYAQHESVVHNFTDGSVANDGAMAFWDDGLVAGSDGNLYGITPYFGSSYGGTFYQLTPSGVETVLHSFNDGSVTNDGVTPMGSLILAKDGNFYGTTQYGGSQGAGTVFKVTTSGAVTILHSFEDGSVINDGANPMGGLAQGRDGNFYGVTQNGGSASEGAIYKITPAGKVTILHSFGDGTVSNDAYNPFEASLILGKDGNFYGTTDTGGSANYGMAYVITPSGAMTILHSFQDGSVANDAIFPTALIQAKNGNFYGTSLYGGSTAVYPQLGDGTVFEMTPTGTVTILHSFGDGSVTNDGAIPFCGLYQNTDGDFYGVTTAGGSTTATNPEWPASGAPGYGTIFKITPAGVVTILHSFDDGTVANDGFYACAPIVRGPDGYLYGTTDLGGSTVGSPDSMQGNGTIYRLSLSAVTIAPKSVLGGATPTGTVHLTSSAETDLIVPLSSSDPTNASVPASVFIAKGKGSATFPIITQPVASVDPVTISAELPDETVSGALTLNPPKLTALSLSTNPDVGGTWIRATVYLSGPAPSGGETVNLSTKTDPDDAVTGFWPTYPSTIIGPITSVTVPAGATSATFVVATQPVPKTVSVEIQGSLNGVTRGNTLEVTPQSAA